MSRFALFMTDREHNVCDINPVQVCLRNSGGGWSLCAAKSEWIEHFECVCLTVFLVLSVVRGKWNAGTLVYEVGWGC